MSSSSMREHYDQGVEEGRLQAGMGALERLRTMDILSRTLPKAPAAILDIGGGPGVYAGLLAQQGYNVDLIDFMKLHVDQANEIFARLGLTALARAEQGDARDLKRPDASADAVLLMGPLYHLTEKSDRAKALREAWRVLKPGGVLAAAAVSRFVSLLDGYSSGFIDDPVFQEVVLADLMTGQHRNPNNTPGYFTTAYLHHPDELNAELNEAGFTDVSVLAVEGPHWLIPAVGKHLDEAARRERLLTLLRTVEREPTLLGASAHLLGLAVKGK